jgi:hypothetical protein
MGKIRCHWNSYIVQLVPYSIASRAAPTALSRLARVCCLVLLGRLDNALKLFLPFGPYERPGIFVVAGNGVQQEFL